jgi:hypothetical protein
VIIARILPVDVVGTGLACRLPIDRRVVVPSLTAHGASIAL